MRLGYLMVVILLLFTRLPVAAQSAITFEPGYCSFAVPANHTVECGALVVPENYEQPEARQIRLAVAIFRHPSGNPEPDPIIYLTGGPGGSSLKFGNRFGDSHYAPFLPLNRDMIVFDQRGAGYSEPALECPDYAYLLAELLDLEWEGQTLSRDAVRLRQQESLMECGAELSAQYDLSQYNSAVSARDIESLRIALGYEQVNLWGVSYGTRLALTMMRDYPASIRSVILDSAYPLEVNGFTDIPANWTHALNALFDACVTDADCNAAYPDLRDVFLATVHELQTHPVRVTATNFLPRATYANTVFDGVLYQQLTFLMLYDTELLPFLPGMMMDVHNGDLQRYIDFISVPIVLERYASRGMHYAVQCREELTFTEPGAIQAAYSMYEELQMLVPAFESAFAICASFQTGQAPAIENEPVTSDIPTLILAGHFDPITPPEWGQLVHANLSNSFYVEFPTMAHGIIGTDSCSTQIAIDFFDSPTRTPDTTCVASMAMYFYISDNDASTPSM